MLRQKGIREIAQLFLWFNIAAFMAVSQHPDRVKCKTIYKLLPVSSCESKPDFPLVVQGPLSPLSVPGCAA